jgi:hypothetical protein
MEKPHFEIFTNYHAEFGCFALAEQGFTTNN